MVSNFLAKLILMFAKLLVSPDCIFHSQYPCLHSTVKIGFSMLPKYVEQDRAVQHEIRCSNFTQACTP